MKSIEINIGNACNNACKFCMVDHDSQNFFVDETTIKNEIIKARHQGYDAIGFLGGEFTLHPQALLLIKICKLLGFKTIHIISNGRRYSDEKFLSQLTRNGANRFSVSIHSHQPAIEDDLTQRPGGFAEKINGLKNLVSYFRQGLIRNPISINLVVNAKNYKDILETLKYFKDLGLNDFRLNFIWLQGRANEYQALFLKYSEFLPLVDQIINLSQQENLTIAFEGIPVCLIKNKDRQQFIGELRDNKTEVVAYNNPTKSREEFNWQERKANEFKVKHDKCRACAHDSTCEGVWSSYIKKYGWDEFKFR